MLGVGLGSDSAEVNEVDGFVRLTVIVTEGSLETELNVLVSTEAGTATPGTHAHTCTKCTFTSCSVVVLLVVSHTSLGSLMILTNCFQAISECCCSTIAVFCCVACD